MCLVPNLMMLNIQEYRSLTSQSTIFSAILGRSHRFLGIFTSTLGTLGVLLKDTIRWTLGSNPGPLAPESETLPLSHRGSKSKRGVLGPLNHFPIV